MRHALLLVPLTTLFISTSALVPSARDVGAAGLEARLLSDFEEFVASAGRAADVHRREKDCIDLRGNIKPRDCTAALKTNGFLGGFYFDDSGKKANPTKDTVVTRDAVVKQVPASQVNTKDYTCDHILELNILKTIINLPGGACDRAEGIADPVDRKARLQKIREVVNRPENLVSFWKTIENIKTKHTQQFNREVVKLPGTPLTFLVMVDYLHQTRSKTLETARLLDAEITKQFGAGTATGVASLWDDYLLYTQKKAVVKEIEVRQQIEDKKKKAQEDAARRAACAANPRPPNPQRRAARSAYYRSSLERRAAQGVRGAARSGANAPPAPSCPLPGAPQKKVMPLSSMKTKPPPKQVPRVAATKPKPKPVKPKKVVTRPANRPRRAPGKAKTKTRVTPRKKPKKVPKPPQKPKGKPRPRRRK